MTSLICSFVYCGFVTNCQRGRLLRHMCSLVRNICYYFIVIGLSFDKTLFTYFSRFRMCLNTSRNHVSRSSVEAFKSVQENKLKMQNY